MEEKIILYAWLALVTLAQALLIALKIIANRNGKRKETENRNNPHPCQEHGERLRGLEVDLIRLREDNKEEHRDLRSDISRIFTILDKIKK